MLVLRELLDGDQVALERAIAEFTTSDPSFTFVFGYTPGGEFSAYVERVRQLRDGIDLPPGFVPSTFLVALEGERIVGRASIRHRLNAGLLDHGGHIGFGVVPAARRRGVATAMLLRCLPIARSLGIERVLVTCDETNLGSRSTIERAGGQLEDIRAHADRRTCRYWITG